MFVETRDGVPGLALGVSIGGSEPAEPVIVIASVSSFRFRAAISAHDSKRSGSDFCGSAERVFYRETVKVPPFLELWRKRAMILAYWGFLGKRD
jgi:hypothetical protein